ncbi:MAG: ABC transporter permease [bacterium]
MTRFRLIMRGAFSPPARAALVVAIIALNAAALFLYWVFAAGIDLSLEREERLLGADIIVLPAGAEFEPEEALLLGAPEGILMSDEILDALAQVPEIERFTPQLYFRSLRLGCCTMNDYPLVGFDPATDFVIRPIGREEKEPIGEHAVVAGCEAARRVVGSKVAFFNHPFRVRERLPCTGMAVDTTFFIPLDVSRRIAGKQLGIGGRDISSVLIKLKRRDQMDYVVELIEYLMEDMKVFKVPVMIRKTAERIRLVEKLLGISLIVLSASGAGLLLFVCWAAAQAKAREAALMRAVGASPAELMKMLAVEMALLGSTGAVVGLGMGFAGLWFGKQWISGVQAPFVLPEAGALVGLAAIAAIVTISATVVAGILLSVRIVRVEPDSALKETR